MVLIADDNELRIVRFLFCFNNIVYFFYIGAGGIQIGKTQVFYMLFHFGFDPVRPQNDQIRFGI